MTQSEQAIKDAIPVLTELLGKLNAAGVEIDYLYAPSSGDHSKSALAPKLSAEAGTSDLPVGTENVTGIKSEPAAATANAAAENVGDKGAASKADNAPKTAPKASEAKDSKSDAKTK